MAEVDPDKLRQALRVTAQIVARDGAAFLPAFLRLESEVAALDVKQGALERAIAMLGDEGLGAKSQSIPKQPADLQAHHHRHI